MTPLRIVALIVILYVCVLVPLYVLVSNLPDWIRTGDWPTHGLSLVLLIIFSLLFASGAAASFFLVTHPE